MNPRINQLLQKYLTELSSIGIQPKRIEDFCGDPCVKGLEDHTKQLEHTAWMISTILLESEDWGDRKINRWLGFIQGVLWCNKLRGILEMRDESRNLYED